MLKLVNKLNIESIFGGVQHQLQLKRNIRFRKPPWVPRSKAKMFRVPPLHIQAVEEKSFMTPIWDNYKAQMRSIYFLFKTEGKFSNKESLVAQEEKKIAMKAEEELLSRNEKINKAILKQQLLDEVEKLEKMKREVEEKYRKKLELDSLYYKVADEKVRKLKEKSKSFIDPNNLEYEIEKILNEKRDYNFAIDASGRMYKDSKQIKQLGDTNSNESDNVSI